MNRTNWIAYCTAQAEASDHNALSSEASSRAAACNPSIHSAEERTEAVALFTRLAAQGRKTAAAYREMAAEEERRQAGKVEPLQQAEVSP
jgi:hypothetical protein